MAIPCSRVSPEPESAQVWSQLDADLRQQAIAVVAQIAFNFVKTQSDCPHKEGDDAYVTHPSQAAQCPLGPTGGNVR